mmetsp:Transcript_483/g.565  ORF Transcript_483/g.565 Transcript_483/m.565 type:complete len:99 (+) Transcript_483:596-892(+)
MFSRCFNKTSRPWTEEPIFPIIHRKARLITIVEELDDMMPLLVRIFKLASVTVSPAVETTPSVFCDKELMNEPNEHKCCLSKLQGVSLLFCMDEVEIW